MRDSNDALVAIVEQKDADEATRKIGEINSGMFCFDKDALFAALRSTNRDNAQNEYYLTDVIATLSEQEQIVRSWCLEDADEVAGINTEDELEVIRRRMIGRDGDATPDSEG